MRETKEKLKIRYDIELSDGRKVVLIAPYPPNTDGGAVRDIFSSSSDVIEYDENMIEEDIEQEIMDEISEKFKKFVKNHEFSDSYYYKELAYREAMRDFKEIINKRFGD